MLHRMSGKYEKLLQAAYSLAESVCGLYPHLLVEIISELQYRRQLVFAIDGFVLGTLTAFTTIFHMAHAITSGSGIWAAIVLFLVTMIVNAIQIVISLYLCKKYGSNYSLLDYIKMFGFSQLELFTYRFVLLYINIIGTFKYFDNDEGWGFVERKGVASISQNTVASSR